MSEEKLKAVRDAAAKVIKCHDCGTLGGRGDSAAIENLRAILLSEQSDAASRGVHRTKEGVWMLNDNESVARHLAVVMLDAAGHDPNDFRLRDKVVSRIAFGLRELLDRIARHASNRNENIQYAVRVIEDAIDTEALLTHHNLRDRLACAKAKLNDVSCPV